MLKHAEIASPERSNSYPFAQHALVAALRVALEAAVFPDKFEIDEQEPRSRIDALAEELARRVQDLECSRSLEDDSIAGKAEAISIINNLTACIRASIFEKDNLRSHW